MMKWLGLSLLFLGLVVAQNQPFDNTLGAAASPEALTGMLNDILLPIVDDVIYEVGAVLPSDCCYQNVGLPGSRFYLENLGIPKESIQSSGSIQTSPRGMFVQANTQFNVSFYLHICEETLGHCTTILRCKGDSNVLFTTDLRMLVNVYPDQNGQPIVLIQDFFFHLDAPVKLGLCNVVDIFLDTLIPLINDAVNLAGAQAISEGLTAVLHDVPQTIPLPEPLFDFHWAMTNSTGSSDAGSALMFDLEVLVNSLGGKPGPFLADPSIPNALSVMQGKGALTMDFSDAIINNIVYSIFTAKDPTIEMKVDGFKVDASLQTSPVFSFTNKTGLDSASLTLDLKIVLKKSVLRITAHSTVTAYFEVVILPEGKITIQLNPDDLQVVITSTSPPVTNATKNLIINDVEQTWASAVPGINQQLMENAIGLPHIADFNHPYISYGTGYAAVGFDTVQAGELKKEKVVRELVKAVISPIGQQMMAVSTPYAEWEGKEANCPNLESLGGAPTACETPRLYDL